MGTISDYVTGNLLQPIQKVGSQPIITTTMSDQTQKTDIKSGEKKVAQFLSKVGTHQYEYKNPERDGQGIFVSPMAQELEATELGKSAVIETPNGKMVDNGRLIGVLTAASAMHHKDIKKINETLDYLTKTVKSSKRK